MNSLDKGLAVNLTPEQYARMAGSGIPLRTLIDLPMGPVYLRIAVRDIAAGKVGSIAAPLRVVNQ